MNNMARLITPIEAHIEVEVVKRTTVDKQEAFSEIEEYHSFRVEQGKIFLPSLMNKSQKGTSFYITYNELCELFDEYERFVGAK